MREDPMVGEEVTLVVELGDCSAEELAEAAESLGGEVTAELRFDSYRVRLPQEAVDEFCGTAGLATVETEDAVGYGGDAGEDVE